MAIEQTLSIIKPDATERNMIGKIISYLESGGLKVVAQKMKVLSIDEAEEFYAEHKERPFYPDLVSYMSSNSVVIMVLRGENAIAKNREIMGATNPEEAKEGTIRRDFAIDIEKNSVHGSDSADSAAREVDFFFAKNEIIE
ncbi:MAG: nucleoside-diphosphate kinase [Rickettsiaceae bacterium]|nr:nucleoside-diphosphate kinase [Rickettsiaceae bacterium]